MYVQCLFYSPMSSTSSLYSLSSCNPILRHYIQECHVQKVTVHAGVLLFDATAISSPRSPDVVLGERVLRVLISCPVCHRIPLTRSVFVFQTTENTPNIIRTRCTVIFMPRPERSAGASSNRIVRPSVCPSVRLSVRNSVPLTNKVEHLKFGW